MAGDAPVVVGGDFWESLLEVTPQLGQCRLLLQRRRGRPRATGAIEDSIDHRGWSAGMGIAGDRLHLVLDPPHTCTGVQVPIEVNVGEGLELCTSDGLRSCEDHLGVLLNVEATSPWLAKLLAPSPVERQQEVESLLCRACGRELLAGGPACGVFLLPTNMWQTSADVMACEECAPLGVAHIAAAPGRIYVSPQCLLVSATDLRPEAFLCGADGFARCSCGVVIGESQIGGLQRIGSSATRTRKKPQRRLFLQEGWASGSQCRHRTIALYKHCVSMPVPKAGAAAGEVVDALGSVTLAAAVGAELLTLRNSSGQARFVLLPSPPTEQPLAGFGEQPVPAHGPPLDIAVDVPQAEALEVRIVVAELVMVGPQVHCAGSQPESQCGEQVAMTRRTAKVHFRRRPCGAAVGECCVLVIPSEALAAVGAELDSWAAVLPPSHSRSPLSAKDGLGNWRTSLLPLPPRESNVE